jgi:hypothetical protein
VFRGRKIGTARRLSKTILLVTSVLFLMIAVRQGGRETGASVTAKAASKPVIVENPVDCLPKGRRAFSIPIDNNNSALSSITEGARVDITAAFPAGPDGMPVAITVLKNVPVIGFKDASGGKTLMLSVSPEDAEKAAFAVANGRIFVSVCPGGPDTSFPSSGVTFDDL